MRNDMDEAIGKRGFLSSLAGYGIAWRARATPEGHEKGVEEGRKEAYLPEEAPEAMEVLGRKPVEDIK